MKIIFKIDFSEISDIKKKIPEFFPENAEFYWDYLEILPMKELENEFYEEVEEGQENFWSIYLHQLSGELECLADLKTKEEAVKLKKMIENTSNYRVFSKSL
jgi:hypothetical protein